jgi:hypothetical protein
VWLRVPQGHERPHYEGLWERASESILEQVMGEDHSLLGGVVSAEDANAASLFDSARRILGDPYAPALDEGPGPGPEA